MPWQWLRNGHVEIATVESLTGVLLPSMLDALYMRYPRITIGVITLGSQTVPDAIIRAQRISEWPLVYTISQTFRGWASGIRLGANMALSHPLACRTEVSFATCAEHRLILAKPDLSVHQLLSSLLQKTALSHTLALETNFMELARKLAKRGAGLAFQTLIGVDADLAPEP